MSASEHEDVRSQAPAFYAKAGAAFVAARAWHCAGSCYASCASLAVGRGAADAYAHAARCYALGQNPQRAIPLLEAAVELYLAEGFSALAAGHQKDLAELRASAPPGGSPSA